MKLSIAIQRWATPLAILALASAAVAEEERGKNLKEPVFRVAHETPATPVSARAVPAALAVNASADFFDLTQRDGEHPLAPCKRLAERVKAHIDANVQDYACTFSKLERIDGELQEVNHMAMEVLHEPFSVHLLFKKPKAGQECLYVKGLNNDNMRARPHGWRARVTGVLTLDPNGARAMDGNRHPITKAGMKNLTDELIHIAENDMKFGECTVNINHESQVNKRATVMMEIVHPVPRREFKFHIARVYVDKELKVPVKFEAYNWTKDDKDRPQLEELYMYTSVKLNNGLGAEHFSESNPAVFK